jgi:hypothetical protein
MQKTVLTFGLISGAIAVLMMVLTLPLVGRVPYEYLTVLGYTAFVVCFLMVFFGIRSYRDKVAQGTITFGRAFNVGILITLISCVIYAVSWEVIYHAVLPDFLVKYGDYVVEKARAAGATQEELNLLMQKNQEFMEMYKNPLIRFAFSMMEAFPVGLLITLISAVVLKRKAAKT